MVLNQTLKIFVPAPVALITSTQLNTTALIGWTCFAVGITSFTILAALWLFQRSERKRYQNQNDGIIIDLTDSIS